MKIRIVIENLFHKESFEITYEKYLINVYFQTLNHLINNLINHLIMIKSLWNLLNYMI